MVWFSRKCRREIRKAVKAGVVVERSSDIDTLFDLNELSFRRQKIVLPYTRSYLRRLFSACEANDAGAVFIARGKDGNVHSAIFGLERTLLTILSEVLTRNIEIVVL